MKKISGLFPIILFTVFACEPTMIEWPAYLGDKASSQYKSLDQINTENVHELEVVWTYDAGDASTEGRSQIQCNPIMVGGLLYGSSPKLKIFAVEAETGKEQWVFDPSFEDPVGLNTNRGVVYWEDGDDKRIIFTAGAWLYALDATTGKLVKDFGVDGKMSLKAELGDRASDLFVASTTPGVVYQDLLVIGTRVSEGSVAAPGHIRAFNIRTGEVVWTFHTIPHPDEFGYDTWPSDAWQRIGGANSWAGMTLDEETGVVYIPTGSASFDFWGGDRKGQNLFANCILALDALTGERIWHFQTVHHDIWDRDLPSPPNLVVVEREGRKIPALTQATKSGHLFILDRSTGEPLFPVEEMVVPLSDLDGEETWSTQPLPLQPEPFSRQVFSVDDINTFFPEYVDSLKKLVLQTRGGGQFIPPSTQGTMYFPGFDGGAEWGGQSYDPETGLLYVNANEMPWIQTMVKIEKTVTKRPKLADIGKDLYLNNCSACHGANREGNKVNGYPSLINPLANKTREEILQIVMNGKGFMTGFSHLEEKKINAILAYLLDEDKEVLNPHEYGLNEEESKVPYTHTGYNRFMLPNGYPAVKPPWGTLSAIDVSKGEIVWQVPLGEFEELAQKGIPQTGTENYGGPVVTAGGLVFIGASKDEYFRAFNKETGQELWKFKLPAGGYATPSTYFLSGRQYVVIACGGGKMGTASGSKYVAFALPDN